MRNAIAVVLFCSLALLSGCAVADSIFGVNEQGEPTPGGGILGTAGSILGYFIPGAPTVAAAAAGVYAAIRGKRWKDAAIATFQTIEEGASVGKSVKDLKVDLKKAHEEAGGNVAKLVQSVVSKLHTPTDAAKA